MCPQDCVTIKHKRLGYLRAVFRIRDILVPGSADPYYGLPNSDPDPALYVGGLQDANKKIFFQLKIIFFSKFLSFIAYFLKIHLYNSSHLKSHKEVTNSTNQGRIQIRNTD
jgi:hypothetical protein